MFKKIIDFSLDNRLLIILLTVLMAGAGVWSMLRLPVDAVPDVTNVQVQVMSTAPALSPLEVERFITSPVENSLAGMPHLDEIRSVSQFGLSVVTVVFEEGTDIYWARQQIGERLQDAREAIPAGVPVPKLGPIATGLGEIYQFQVRNAPGFQHDLMKLREVLEWQIAYQLKSVPGVVEINALGGELRAYEVRLDPRRLQEFKIPIGKVYEAVKQNNSNEGGGYLLEHTGEHRIIRGEGVVNDVESLKNIVLDTRQDGTPVYLSQVAEVVFAPVLRQGAVTRDAKGEAVVGIVMLLAGENGREVVARVREKIDEIRKTLPEGIEIDVFYDRTELVERTVKTLIKNLWEGGALVIFVLLILLGSVRAGLIVALAVPLAMLGAFVGMLYAGLSGNLMSLGAIDFGLIVDGSVVMIENVVRWVAERKHHTGQKKVEMETIRLACHEVARPVVFGVGIIVLVYLPILSLRGIEGKMFRPMALTVLFALITSLILALTLMPVLASVFLRTVSEKEPILIRLAKKIYGPLLRIAMSFPGVLFLISALAFAVSVMLAMNMGAQFIPKLDENSIAFQASRLPSSSLETSVQMTSRVEECLMKIPEIQSVICKSGRPEIAIDPMPISLTDVVVMLKPRSEWTVERKQDIVDQIKEHLEAEVPGNKYTNFSQPIELRIDELISGTKAEVGISIYGDDLTKLRETANDIARVLNTLPEAREVAVEVTGGLPYLRIIVNRKAVARYGVNVSAVLDAVAAIGGKEVGAVFEEQRRFPIQVRLGPDWRNDLEKLKQVKIADAQGRQIPMELLAEFVLEEGPMQISRESIRRRTIVECGVKGEDLAGFVSRAKEAIEREVTLPTGYTLSWGGQFKNLEEASKRLAIAVPIALLLIFVLLQSTFQSTRLALLIYLNVPLAATGGIIALWLRDMPLSISAGVGFIALFGVAVLNGVVLVTYIVSLRKSGKDLETASFEGAMTRIRPVLMTALVATLGFIPMAISRDAGAEVQQPLATVVIGGLITSTLLTLFVLPSLYRIFDSRSEPDQTV
ncbi:efflux RND transporter permease subunit [Telmatocola sphagniphila]|uniref:Efflux RND transporter permease subunit n=1 Tax=Telmatocola sphagniphila TaxID=1123043 RepID=A0A8E6BAL3_9BACT|nr:CusA/CzcA family heavy metal efflux RND transporter [Telmatocola sphagniphila]QVL34191.1 efflux RND transporter permease subunit [Telmatocola sphagniphila]